MNHRDTTILMFFLLGGLILTIIIIFILCGVLFLRIRNETTRNVHRSNSNRKQSKLANVG